MIETKNWKVVKVGRRGWSLHSDHYTKEAAEYEALRNNIFSDAQFSVWPADAADRLLASRAVL